MRRYRYKASGGNRATASSGAANIQRKLTVGETNDPMEHQADDMADKVMRMPDRALVQRSAAEKDDENIQRKRLAPKSPFIQAKGDGGGVASHAVTNGIKATQGGGNTMDRGTKSFMESRFGNDFSDVKIHTGDYAIQMSEDLNAQAFTVGNDIYFNSGKYAPEASGGKHLLAHELTHTIQQGKSIKPKIQKQGNDDELQPTPGKLTMPKLLPNLPDFGVHLGDYKFHLPRPAPLDFHRPLFKFLPPVSLQLTPAQIRNIIGVYSPDLFASIPDISQPDNDGLRLGGDQFVDMFTGNNQITAVARGLDFYNIKNLSTVFDALDILHEPGVTFTAARPGSGTLNSVQFGVSLLNFHYGKKVEFAPIQLGVDTGSGVTLGSQVELHTPDPHYSYFFNFGYTVQPGPKGNYLFNTTGISFSFFPHFLNP